MKKLYVFFDQHTNVQGMIKHDTEHWTATLEPDVAPDGRAGYSFSVPDNPQLHGSTMRVTSNGVVIKHERGIVAVRQPGQWFPRDDRDVIWTSDDYGKLSPPVPFPETGSLAVSGPVFLNDGQDYIKGLTTSFDLFQRWLDGDIAGVDRWCAWVASIGSKGVRCFGMWYWRNPDRQEYRLENYPQYWDELPKFIQHVNAVWQLRVEWTGLTDCQILLPTLAQQVAYTQRAMDTVHSANPGFNFYEIGNEPFDNGFSDRDIAANISIPAGLLIAPGSYDAPPHLFRLSSPNAFGTNHTSRGDHWMADAKELLDQRNFSGQPEDGDEPCKAGDIHTGDTDDRPAAFGDYAAVAALLGNGGTFHHVEHYTRVDRITPNMDACGREFFKALRWVPPHATRGEYVAGHLSNCPIEFRDEWSLRTFGRIIGGDAWINVTEPHPAGIGPDGQVHAFVRNGWQIVSRDGPNGRRIHLQR